MKNVIPAILFIVVWLFVIHILAANFRYDAAIHSCQDTGDC